MDITLALITGSSSMIGRALKNRLYGKYLLDCPTHKELDLTDQQATDEYFRQTQPDFVFHLAGYNGNIQFNEDNPSDIFYNNSMMALNVLKGALDHGTSRVVSLIPTCAYPDKLTFYDDDILRGAPHRSVECHGLAKRNLVAYGKQINKDKSKRGPQCITCVVNTVYGPEDSFDPAKTKVMGSVIKKIVDAKFNNEKQVVMWGDGSAERTFNYVDDVVDFIIEAFENRIGTSWPVGLFGSTISIKDLYSVVADIVGYGGKIVSDKSKPSGQHSKKLLSYREPATPLKVGIAKTVDWYIENYWPDKYQKSAN